MTTQEIGYFSEGQSDKVVTARNARAQDPRLTAVMEFISRKRHEATKEIEPTAAQVFRASLFLTDTGQMRNAWRQEFILLSDVLGVSMLVDAINNRKPSGASEATVLGPFHDAEFDFVRAKA